MRKRLFRFPLGVQVVIWGILVSFAVWFLLDSFQSRQFQKYAADELGEELGRSLRSSRARMNDYKARLRATALMLAGQDILISYAEGIVRKHGESESYLHHRRPPAWLVPQNRWRDVLPSHFLLIDSDRKFGEVYSVSGEKMSDDVLDSIFLLLPKCRGQVLLTTIDGIPRFVTAADVNMPESMGEARLVLIRNIDSDWMRIVYPYTALDDLPVVMVTGDPARIVASNTNETISKGDLLDELSHKYIIASKGFEDYGSAEVELNLAILVERKRAQEFSGRLLSKDRMMRMSLAVLLVLVLLGFTLLLVRRIGRLTRKVRGFVEEELDQNLVKSGGGDELQILDESLSYMTKKMRLSFRKLQESEEKYRSIIENAAEGVFQNTADGKLLNVNARLAEILSYGSPEELIESDADKRGRFYADREKREHLFNLIKRGNVVTDYEIGLLRRDGKKVCGSLNARPVFDEDGTFLYIEGFLNDISLRKEAEEEREKLITELQKALKKVKTLSGLLPICASCKKVRDDKGYWTQIESYISAHSEADFSHGLCPECAEKLYPDVKSKGKDKN